MKLVNFMIHVCFRELFDNVPNPSRRHGSVFHVRDVQLTIYLQYRETWSGRNAPLLFLDGLIVPEGR